jgi:hypothetical protein
MFPNPITAYEVKMMEQRELVAAASRWNRLMTTAMPAHGTLSIVGNVRQILGATFDRISLLLPDSRDSLRAKEQELAAVGVTWRSDPAHDEMLARQIEAARRRRHAGYPAGQSVSTQATSGSLPKGSLAPQPPTVPAQA